jgi:hypothetical protein
MRTFIYVSLFIMVTGMLSTGLPPAASAAPQIEKAADTKDFVMQSGGANVLKLATTAGTICVAEDGSLKFAFDSPKYYIQVWLVSGAKTVDKAMGLVSSQIVSEFKNFKSNQTSELTIAGSPAKRMVGDGEEADDGDPGKADVIVFKVGDHVFVACDHGETINETGQQGLLTLVQTAHMP